MSKGTLFLIPSTISETKDSSIINTVPAVIEVLNKTDDLVMETPKAGRAFVKKVIPNFDFQSKRYFTLNKFSSEQDLNEMMTVLRTGKDLGLLSDAGCPCIADPGNILVAACHKEGIKVVPITGPSSILLALIASGFNGQFFTFRGYLPKDDKEQTKIIKAIEIAGNNRNETNLFMETPFRNEKILDLLIKTLHPETYLLIASNISTESEFIYTKKIKDWLKSKPNITKKPTIFGIGQIQTQGVKSR
jgi:16S rRNA (cytidine1402-2'-O)-methyltransferase